MVVPMVLVEPAMAVDPPGVVVSTDTFAPVESDQAAT